MTANNSSARTIAYSRVIDLSHIIHPHIPLWPGDPAITTHTVATLAQDGYFLRQLTIGEHSGTHINAPISFHPTGVGIESYPPESLVAPAVVLDVSRQAAGSPDYLLTVADVLAWEQRWGQAPAGAVVLLSTGWAARWGHPAAFLGIDAGGGLHFPGFSEAAADYLLTECNIGGVGIDTHGVDGGQSAELQVNRRVLAAPRLVLENLANLDRLPARGTTLVIGILRLRGGTGSPAAVLAFVP